MKLTDEQIIKPCGVVCGDNRFELIKKYKQMLFEQTNIETANDQVAVIDGILFRFWQMGWLDKLEEFDHQKAEIERLKEESKNIDNLLSLLDRPLFEVKSKSIKEFWNRLKFKKCNGYPYVLIVDGDNLVKEMVGE